ncbi:hypothetical protein Q5P01_012078 [Channa striata]|uniref:Uncharacterized protein n=1 Tax=Channa striata TaxID=64152 RepID=A0AA88MRP5_CHASR|nr:hypothetical protein Q5P01_012078 [Channa striata]
MSDKENAAHFSTSPRVRTQPRGGRAGLTAARRETTKRRKRARAFGGLSGCQQVDAEFFSERQSTSSSTCILPFNSATRIHPISRSPWLPKALITEGPGRSNRHLPPSSTFSFSSSPWISSVLSTHSPSPNPITSALESSLRRTTSPTLLFFEQQAPLPPALHRPRVSGCFFPYGEPSSRQAAMYRRLSR